MTRKITKADREIYTEEQIQAYINVGRFTNEPHWRLWLENENVRSILYGIGMLVGIGVLYCIDPELIRGMVRLLGLVKDLYMIAVIALMGWGAIYCLVSAFKREPRFMIVGSLGFAGAVWAITTWL